MPTTPRKDLTAEIAPFARDHRFRSFAGLLRANDATLATRGGGRGLSIYDDIERDCHAYAVIQKRKMAPIAREWHVDPASDSARDRAAAELVTRHLKGVRFDRLCLDLMDAVLKGYAVVEILWRIEGREIVPTRAVARDQQRFVFDEAGALRLLTPDAPVQGIELPERKFIVHSFGAKDGNPFGLGLGTRLFWPVFFKRQGVTFWLSFADKFASPTPVGKYPGGATAAEKETLEAALDSLAHETGVIVPDGMSIELVEAQRSGSTKVYEGLTAWCDAQISEAVLGETLSTNIGDVGSKAASQTHNEVREELAKADADLLSDTLNGTLVRWIVDLNMPGAAAPAVWRNFEQEEDLNQRAERDGKVMALGFRPTLEYVLETYGPGWEEDKGQATGGSGQTVAQNAAFAAAPGPGPAGDALDGLAETLDQAAAPAMDAMIDRIRELVDGAASLDDIAAGLLDLYAGMDPTALSEAIGAALMTADLAGRAEVANG